MTQTAYNHILQEIKTMSLLEQLRILEQTAALVRNTVNQSTERRSIMELKGKGKEIWQNIDVQKYLDEERSSWT